MGTSLKNIGLQFLGVIIGVVTSVTFSTATLPDGMFATGSTIRPDVIPSSPGPLIVDDTRPLIATTT